MERDNRIIDLKTDHDIGSRSFAEDLLREWIQLPERLWIDRYGSGEPIRTPFDLHEPTIAIDAWVREGRPLYFRRSRKFAFDVTFNWRRERGKDARSHPWSSSAFLPLEAPFADVVTMFEFLISHVRPAWGCITTWSEIVRRHEVSLQQRIGTVTKLVGRDIGETLPGLGQRTYFDAQRVQWIGAERFERLPAGSVAAFLDGRIVSIGEPFDQRRDDVLAVLGPERFFDKSRFDARSLAFGAKSAEAIEKAIDSRKRDPS